MDLLTDAPIARLDYDTAISSSTDDVEERASSIEFARSDIDDLDCEMYLNGSLSDLVIGFDDVISGLVVDEAASTSHSHSVQNGKTTLSDVKFWWKEACTSTKSSEYPLQKAPSVPRLYEEFELADADGVTEDPHSEANAELHLLVHSERPTLSERSLVGTNSFVSSQTSLRSTTPDAHGGISVDLLPSSCWTVEPPTPTMESVKKKTNADTHLSTESGGVAMSVGFTDLAGFSPLDSAPPALTALELHSLPTGRLEFLVQQFTAEVMRLSDSLVDSLATREELVMLREASDDFIHLLRLLHQRRTRASRAALMATAKTRIRFKKFTNISLPWRSKRVHALNNNDNNTNKSSTTSLASRAPLHLQTTNLSPGEGSLGSHSDLTTDSIDLSPQSGTVAYYRSLQLQSKQRRPRSRPFATAKANGVPPSVRPQVASNSVGNGGEARNGQQDSQTAPPVASFKVESLKRAADRFEEIRRICLFGDWPNGQPKRSQCLTLQVPHRERDSGLVTLRDLRLLNQILHHAILEKPSTPTLVENYSHVLKVDSHLLGWIHTSGYQYREDHGRSGHNSISVVYCDKL